jgi:hypothetical protein
VTLRLYDAFGMQVPETKLVELHGAHQGGTGIASKWINGLEPFNPEDPDQLRQVQENFVTNTWVSHWDVVGEEFENTQFKDGRPVYIDGGFSLYWGPNGEPRDGNAFFSFSATDVPEVTQMSRSAWYGLRKTFGRMTYPQLEQSAQKFGARFSRTTVEELEALAAPYGAAASRVAGDLWRRGEDLMTRDFNEPDLEESLHLFREEYGPMLREKRASTGPEANLLRDKEYVAIRKAGDDAFSKMHGRVERDTDADADANETPYWAVAGRRDEIAKGLDKLAALHPETGTQKAYNLDMLEGNPRGRMEVGGTYGREEFLSATTDAQAIKDAAIESPAGAYSTTKCSAFNLPAASAPTGKVVFDFQYVSQPARSPFADCTCRRRWRRS